MSDMKCPNIKIYKCSDGFVTDNAQVAKSHEANIKSNKLICPFCQQELDRDLRGECGCINEQCQKSVFMFGSEELWQELIRTRKALGMALDWLREVATPEKCDDELCREFTSRKLAEIKTTLEQKEEQ